MIALDLLPLPYGAVLFVGFAIVIAISLLVPRDEDSLPDRDAQDRSVPAQTPLRGSSRESQTEGGA